MTTNNQKLGTFGEQYVIDHLVNKNFSVLAQNFRTQLGEIDIIVQKENLVVFVEVKTRKSNRFSLHGLISFSKQQKIILTAKQYIVTMNKQEDLLFRFDVALLHYKKETNQYYLEYIPNAFGENE